MIQTHPQSAEETAVMDVIMRETEAFLKSDFDAWSTCWVQDERTREVCVSSSFGATVLEGWSKLSSYMRDVIENGSVCDVEKVQRENVSITISGKLAHVVFDELSLNASGETESTFETRVLEQKGGVWRILYASFVLRGHQSLDRDRLAVDATGKVLCAPDKALKHLEHHPGLQISNNRLRASKPSWDKLLQAGLKRAADQHGYFQHYKYMTESGRSFRIPIILGETDEGSVAVCILFVRDGITFVETQQDGDTDGRLMLARDVFGLSDGQMQLARHIVRGDNLTTASDTLGFSINTARTHLSRIYAKTGVNSQTALVRTLLSVG